MNNEYLLNMNFDRVALSLPEQQTWVESPSDGVSRIHLEREAEESGHTTSFVRFAPGSHFSPHTHPQGEEILQTDAYETRLLIRDQNSAEALPSVSETGLERRIGLNLGQTQVLPYGKVGFDDT